MIMSAGDVQEITGLTPGTLTGLCAESGLDKPRNGHGYHIVFSMPDLIALSLGKQMQLIGCGHVVVQAVVKYLSGFSERKLLAQFKKGKTILFPIPGYVRLERPQSEDFVGSRLDVEHVYNEVLKAVNKLEQELPAHVEGRKRGLASSTGGKKR